MGQNSKQIKARIKSVKSTKKITKSMELISAIKMQKIARHIQKSKEYSQLSEHMLEKIGTNVKIEHKLLKPNESEIELLVVIASDKGLCGSYNYNVLKLLKQKAATFTDTSKVKVLAIGRKAGIYAKKVGLDVIGIYEKIGENPDSKTISPIVNDAMSKFQSEEYSKVSIIYTKYISGIQNITNFKQLLPISDIQLEESSDQISEKVLEELNEAEDINFKEKTEYLIEPNPAEVLDYILPKIFGIQFFQYLLESSASEHSSRMSAMKNATEAATEIATTLTYELNKSRQAQITQEVAEIVGGIQGIKKLNSK